MKQEWLRYQGDPVVGRLRERRIGNKQSERPKKLTDAHSSLHLELIVFHSCLLHDKKAPGARLLSLLAVITRALFASNTLSLSRLFCFADQTTRE